MSTYDAKMSYLLDDYDAALETILKRGVRKKNRTGVDSLAVFCIQSRYKINEFFPLLTRRKIWPKSVFGELLWFISGSSNNKDLQKLGVEYWTPWVDKEFEKRNGYADGSLGPVYGFQLRHFDGEYGNGIGGMSAWNYANQIDPHCGIAYHEQLMEEGRNLDYFVHYERPGPSKGRYYGMGGFDQLAWMIEQLKTNPDSRRNLFSLWNPKQIDMMRLAPCHYTFQVYVENGNLSGVLTQRSCDFPVGVPYNIAFYSGLIYMLAQQTNLKPYEFVHSTVDSHIYVNQVDGVEEYLSRPKPDCPKLLLEKADNIDSYSVDSFQILDYNPLEAIKLPVAV